MNARNPQMSLHYLCAHWSLCVHWNVLPHSVWKVMPMETDMKYIHNANVLRAWGTLYMFFSTVAIWRLYLLWRLCTLCLLACQWVTMKAIQVFVILFTACGVFVWQFWQLKQTCYEHTAYIYIYILQRCEWTPSLICWGPQDLQAKKWGPIIAVYVWLDFLTPTYLNLYFYLIF